MLRYSFSLLFLISFLVFTIMQTLPFNLVCKTISFSADFNSCT